MLRALVRTYAAQDGCLGLPYLADRLGRAVRLHVVLDAVGGAAQGELAQGHQVALAEEIARGALDLLGNVDLARFQPGDQLVGRDVHQHDLVGDVEEGVGHRLPHANARDLADHVVQALDVLDVERGPHVDPGMEQLRDILPALGMARAGRVGVRELIDQEEPRMARECRIEVELADRAALHVERSPGQLLEPFEQCSGVRAAVRLDETHDHVVTLVARRTRGAKHRVSLARARRGAEEDLEPPAARARLLRPDFGEKLVGIRTLAHAGGDRWRALRPRGRPTSAYGQRRAASSARLRPTTSTRGSPRIPSVRPWVCAATRPCTCSTVNPRTRATRAAW